MPRKLHGHALKVFIGRYDGTAATIRQLAQELGWPFGEVRDYALSLDIPNIEQPSGERQHVADKKRANLLTVAEAALAAPSDAMRRMVREDVAALVEVGQAQMPDRWRADDHDHDHDHDHEEIEPGEDEMADETGLQKGRTRARMPSVAPPAERECYDCRQTKPIAAFVPNNNSVDGYSRKCRTCYAASARKGQITARRAALPPAPVPAPAELETTYEWRDANGGETLQIVAPPAHTMPPRPVTLGWREEGVLTALLQMLPVDTGHWTTAEKARWLRALDASLDLVIEVDDGDHEERTA